MHAAIRESLILEALGKTGFVSYRELEQTLEASPATIRRDLTRLERTGRIVRVHGGAKIAPQADEAEAGSPLRLTGTPFDKAITQNLAQKQAIGKAAAYLCRPGEGIMIDGGSTTLQMCPHLAGLGLQVLTNSLHIVNALLPQENTRISCRRAPYSGNRTSFWPLRARNPCRSFTHRGFLWEPPPWGRRGSCRRTWCSSRQSAA